MSILTTVSMYTIPVLQHIRSTELDLVKGCSLIFCHGCNPMMGSLSARSMILKVDAHGWSFTTQARSEQILQVKGAIANSVTVICDGG